MESPGSFLKVVAQTLNVWSEVKQVLIDQLVRLDDFDALIPRVYNIKVPMG